jgi:CheY-like chemotaxis protein
VTNTGIGIPSETLPHVFEAFTQADRSLDRTRGGLGLGLSLVRGIVQLHEGVVTAESTGEGHGAVITARLPREPEPAALEPGAPPARSTARAVVLVIEDNLDAADTLRMVLEVSGFEAHAVHTGPAGVQAAREIRPRIVLSDIGLPGMDGYAVARTLRDDPITATCRLIAITGYGADGDRERALAAGFDLHLVKPVAPERLVRELNTIAAA